MEEFMSNELTEIMNRAVDRVNELLPSSSPLPKTPDTVLIGSGAWLDSMGFVNLQAALEEEVKARLGVDFVLADYLPEQIEVYTLGDLGDVLARVTQQGGRDEKSR